MRVNIGFLVLTDDRSFGLFTVTSLPNFLGWVDLLTHGAPLVRASCSRELRYQVKQCRVQINLLL